MGGPNRWGQRASRGLGVWDGHVGNTEWSSGFLQVETGDLSWLAVARFAEDPLGSPWLVFDVWWSELWLQSQTWEAWIYVRADIASKRLEGLIDFSREAPEAEIVAVSIPFDSIEDDDTHDLLLEALYGWPEPLLEVAMKLLSPQLAIRVAPAEFLADPLIAPGVDQWLQRRVPTGQHTGAPEVGPEEALLDLHAGFPGLVSTNGDLGWLFSLDATAADTGPGWVLTTPVIDRNDYYTGDDQQQEAALDGLADLLRTSSSMDVNSDWKFKTEDLEIALDLAAKLLHILDQRIESDAIEGLSVNGWAVEWDGDRLVVPE